MENGFRLICYKNGTEKLCIILAHIFIKCINGEEISEEWQTAYIRSVHKKDNKIDRCGLSVTSTVLKYRDVIVTQYKFQTEEELCSFHAGSSCTKHVFCLKQDVEKKYIGITILIFWNQLRPSKCRLNMCFFIKRLIT